MKKLILVILAGGTTVPPPMSPDKDVSATEETNRALFPLCGRPMLEYVLNALYDGVVAAHYEPNFVLVGDGLPVHENATMVPGGVTLIDSLINGLNVARNVPDPASYEARVLISTADIPFLTAEAVTDLLQRFAENPDAAFQFPIVDGESCRAAFPGMKRTTLRLAEGEFTGGNIVLVAPDLLHKNQSLLKNAYAQRKSVNGLAQLLGTETLVRLFTSRLIPSLLPLSYLEKTVGRILGGVSAYAVVTPYPEIAADVDRMEDLAIAEKILQQQANSFPPWLMIEKPNVLG